MYEYESMGHQVNMNNASLQNNSRLSVCVVGWGGGGIMARNYPKTFLIANSNSYKYMYLPNIIKFYLLF